MKKGILLILLGLWGIHLFAQTDLLNKYNVTWNKPSENSLGSMPAGNGDIGANVWMEKNGDLFFYISKTDLWSENGQLLKMGLVKISLEPSPVMTMGFSQELKLENGEISFNCGNSTITFWVDANNPSIMVDIQSRTPVKTRVTLLPWRKSRRPITGRELHAVYGVVGEETKGEKCAKEIWQEPDVIVRKMNSLMWYHYNNYSHWKDNMELQALGGYMEQSSDPLLGRIFGGLIRGSGMISDSDSSLISSKAVRRQNIVMTALTDKCAPQEWERKITGNSAHIEQASLKQRKAAHYRWWQKFWERSFIYVSSDDSLEKTRADVVTRGYILQRYITACAGRGKYPVKFNGSIFTVDCYNRKDNFRGFDADFRQWGGPYWWQNTRLPYWTMLISGDFDMMRPFFGMYLDNLPLRKYATKKYYNHEGAFFPETMNFWGTFASENYGCDRTGLPDGYTTNNYIRYYWQGALEMSMIMLDYYAFTSDEGFASDTLLPYVTSILDFYDNHWQRGPDGKILFSPAMSLETFHTAVNPLPEIVGIRAVAQRLLDLNLLDDIERRNRYLKLLNDLPGIPLRMVGSDTLIAPAYEYSLKRNVENPELYAIFPYRHYGVDKPQIKLALRTFEARTHKENFGWQQNSIQAAYLGLADEAARMVAESFSRWDPNFRFPAFWGPNYDWTPDQDHGNVAVSALQRMIIQYENDKFQILPAWPGKWNVVFRVNAPGNVRIEGEYRNGKVVSLKSTGTMEKIRCHK